MQLFIPGFAKMRSIIFLSLFLCASGCSLSDLVGGDSLPSDTSDPGVVKTPEGALGAYYSATVALTRAVGAGWGGSVVMASGLMTDELHSINARLLTAAAAFPTGVSAVDARAEAMDKEGEPLYNALNLVRGRTREAVGALRKYYPQASPDLIAHLFAIEGMAEVMLAEFFCSGIPLSTLNFEGDYTLKAGSSTQDVLQHSLSLFDSARALSADSSRFIHFASIGRARALIALHDVSAAAQAVADVPTEYNYLLFFGVDSFSLFKTSENTWSLSVSNKEGHNGLHFITDADPRTVSDSLTGSGGPWVPRKYVNGGIPGSNPGSGPINFASGVEARLIEAEAALISEDGNWLAILNKLRTSCLEAIGCPTPAPAGTGGIANLPLLNDPGIESLPEGKTVQDVRLDLLFRERAYWLFLTGRRQGDLRRLVQQYNREQDTVYPIGLWGVQGLAAYGSRIYLPVPVREQETNHLYRGCED